MVFSYSILFLDKYVGRMMVNNSALLNNGRGGQLLYGFIYTTYIMCLLYNTDLIILEMYLVLSGHFILEYTPHICLLIPFILKINDPETVSRHSSSSSSSPVLCPRCTSPWRRQFRNSLRKYQL